MERNPLRSVAVFSAIAVWTFLFLSTVSFNPLDPPSHAVYPYASEVTNLCGKTGAYVSYWIRYAIGPGIYPVLFFSAVFLGLMATKNRISDMWLRLTGVALLAVSFAAIVHQLSNGSATGLPEGNGGVMGIASSHFLRSHFNAIGSMLALASVMLVGLILAADDLVMRAPSALGNAMANAKLRMPSAGSLMNFKFPEMPKLPSMPKFVTREGGAVRVSRDEVGVDDEEEAKPNPIVGRGKKTPPPPTDKPNLKYVPAPSEDDDIELDFPADDVAMEDPHDPGPSEAAVIPERPAPVVGTPAALPDVPDAELIDGDDEVEVAAPVEEPKREIKVRLPSMQKPKQMAPQPPKELGDYTLPSWDYLADAEHGYAETQEAFVRAKAAELEGTLKDFNIDAHVVEIDTGPVITMYELALAAGIKVSTITGLTNDIQRALRRNRPHRRPDPG
ncbi:MAG: DNA translocase FtsK 4TM domain-containing protein [Tepidisphaeraceae bacterium]